MEDLIVSSCWNKLYAHITSGGKVTLNNISNHVDWLTSIWNNGEFKSTSSSDTASLKWTMATLNIEVQVLLINMYKEIGSITKHEKKLWSCLI